MDLTEEKKLSNEEIEEIINLYIAQYEEYKKYGSVVAKVSPQFVIKLIHQLQDENEKVVQDYYSARQTCEEQKDIIAEQKTKIEQLTERLDYFQKSSDYHEGNQKELEAKNAEFQKQVDELEERVRELITDCDNCPLPRQAVKDTVKEIFDWLKSKVIMTEIPHGSEPSEEDVEAVMWWQIEEHFKKRYGVEVE